LKKRTKKLLIVSRSRRLHREDFVWHATVKSFLVLFFKKALLPCFLLASACWSTPYIGA
jgi:hypothetical protein